MSEGTTIPIPFPVILLPVLLGAAILWFVRSPRPGNRDERITTAELFLAGVACQCAHFVEEFATDLHRVYPPLFGMAPVSDATFVTINVLCIGVWTVSAVGIQRGIGAAYFPAWFFALGMCLNGVIHPLLAVWTRGYFPGLVTAPLAGVMGILVVRRLFRVTGPGER